MRRAALAAMLFVAASPALADDNGDAFANAANGAKLHVASGFSCPAAIGRFGRDAVGEREPENGEDFCAYSALDGLYGTIVLRPLKGPYDPKTALVAQFVEQEHTGAKLAGEAPLTIAGTRVYTRTYRIAGTAEVSYRVLFAASAVGNWALEVTMEYASPRDDAMEQDFLSAVYGAAFAKLAH